MINKNHAYTFVFKNPYNKNDDDAVILITTINLEKAYELARNQGFVLGELLETRELNFNLDRN